jgi:hypothetical protein
MSEARRRTDRDTANARRRDVARIAASGLEVPTHRATIPRRMNMSKANLDFRKEPPQVKDKSRLVYKASERV